MQEVYGDLWSFPAALHVITTNGDVTRHGDAVMGRGCAREARERFPSLARELGGLLERHGNHVHYLGAWAPFSPASGKAATRLASFPVKTHWTEDADPVLIARSARELVAMVDASGFSSIVLPRPGRGNGGLMWEDMRPMLTMVLDDRFCVITKTQRECASERVDGASSEARTGD